MAVCCFPRVDLRSGTNEVNSWSCAVHYVYVDASSYSNVPCNYPSSLWMWCHL